MVSILKRFKVYSKENSLLDLLRKIICFLFKSLLFFKMYKKFKFFIHFKKWNIHIGRNVIINGFINNISLGKNISIYDNVIFEFGNKSKFQIGNNSLLSFGVLVSCFNKINIGNETQIGEYTSIRDTTHDHSEFGVPMKYNPDISKEIIIGNNVWIGRGCIVMPGTIIEDGVVVGANSIVKGRLVKDSIYAGSPIKIIKKRN
jgi:acetyltransferase-like isoleucine patch superfamily enzyme